MIKLILRESFSADYNSKKSKQNIYALAFDNFCKKYNYKFDKERLDPYDAQFIIDKSWAKIENGVVYRKEHSIKDRTTFDWITVTQ